MEPTRETLSQDPAGAPATAWGELVVKNGRLAGTRHPLETPLILVGGAPSCDVRLRAGAIRPFHCAVVFTPNGAVVRELQGKGGVTVNGEVAGHRFLHDDDEICFGPFRFQIHLVDLPTIAERDPLIPADTDPRDEAVRIQAAAIVAQQAALDEVEVRLEQRRVALEKQQAQLASHLEDKRRRLVDLRNQAKEAHAALKDERGRQQKEAAETVDSLACLRGEVDDGRQQLLHERRRLFRLRVRLRQRMHRHWAAERASIQLREQAVAARHSDLDKDAQRLHEERQELYRARLQFNGEAELGKRQLADGWAQLTEERRAWEAERAREHAAARERDRVLEQREIDLADVEREMADQRRQWEVARLRLEKEIEGLEARIRNQRRKMGEQEDELRRQEAALRATTGMLANTDGGGHGIVQPETSAHVAEKGSDIPVASTLPPASDYSRKLAELEALASELADQRLCLVEQCERFEQARKKWRHERDAAAAALEPLARSLDEREQKLREREQSVATAEADNRRRHERIAQQRQHLEAWQARLTLRTSLWEAERERLMADLNARERKAQAQVAAVTQVRRRWQQCRTQELERLRTLLASGDRVRQECIALKEAWLARGTELEQQRRTLAERALSVEEYRFTYVQKEDDRALAEQRLQRLHERWNSEFESVAQTVVRERLGLVAAAERIHDSIAALRKELPAVAAREAEWSRHDMEREQELARATAEQENAQSEIQRLLAQADVHEAQIRALSEEVERLARTLLDDNEPGLGLVRAA